MTNFELNRDIKRLAKKFMQARLMESKDYFDFIETTVKPEFKRLYHADKEFTAMNLQSIKIMLRINLSIRVIELHNFGLHIELEKYQ